MCPESPLSRFTDVNPPRPQILLEPKDMVSFIPMADVTNSGRWDNRQVRQFWDVKQGYVCFQNNDVLFAKITPCMENGKGCLVTNLENGVGFGSTEFHVLRARDNGDPKFIYQWSIYAPLRLKAAGSMTGSAGQQRVPASFLETFMIPTIEKHEQAKIGEILCTVDKAIEQTEALIAKQQHIKTGLMQDLLTRGIDEHGNLRSEKTHQFKDSPLGRIPVEWEARELGTVAFVTKLAGFEFTNYFDYESVGEVIALRALNIKNENLDLSDVQRISKAISDKLPRSKIFAGDILITYIGAYIGDVLRIEEDDKYHLAPNIAKIVAGKLLVPRFLEAALRSTRVRTQIHNLTATTATPSLTMTQIRKLMVAIPLSRHEQHTIASRVCAVSAVLNSQNAKLEKLRSLKTALMQDLLTGKVRVTPLLDSAEVTSE